MSHSFVDTSPSRAPAREEEMQLGYQPAYRCLVISPFFTGDPYEV